MDHALPCENTMTGRSLPCLGAVTLTCRSASRPSEETAIGLTAKVCCCAGVGMDTSCSGGRAAYLTERRSAKTSGTLFREQREAVSSDVGAREAGARRTREALLEAATEVFVE